MPLEAVRDSRLPISSSRGRLRLLFGVVVALALCAGGARAQDSLATIQLEAPPAPAAPQGIHVADVPNDKGTAVTLSWTASADEKDHPERVTQYRIYRGSSADGPFAPIDSVAAGTSSKNDETVKAGQGYWYRVSAL